MYTQEFPFAEDILEYSLSSSELSMFLNRRWAIITPNDGPRETFLFKGSYDYVQTQKGIAQKGKWEFITVNTILITDKNEDSYVFERVFLEKNVMFFRLEDSERYAVFVEAEKHKEGMSTLAKVEEYLYTKYINPPMISKVIEEPKVEIIPKKEENTIDTKRKGNRPEDV